MQGEEAMNHCPFPSGQAVLGSELQQRPGADVVLGRDRGVNGAGVVD